MSITSLEFTEKMKGHVTFGERDFETGYRRGRRDRTYLMFRLTIEVLDVDRFVDDPMLEANARGYVKCDELGGQAPVERGVFNLFVESDDPTHRRMLYRLHFQDGVGHPLTLTGFKEVRNDPGFDLWSDTSTLYTRILRGHVGPEGDADAEVVASGILRIKVLDFLKQLTTFRARGTTLRARARAFTGFGRLFLGTLWKTYRPGTTRRAA